MAQDKHTKADRGTTIAEVLFWTLLILILTFPLLVQFGTYINHVEAAINRFNATLTYAEHQLTNPWQP